MPWANPGVIINASLRGRTAAITAAAVLAAVAVTDTATPAEHIPAAYAAAPPQSTAQVDDLLAERQIALTRASRPTVTRPPTRPRVRTRPPVRPREHASTPQQSRHRPLVSVKLPDSARAAAVLAYALAQVGDRYVWGAAGPNSWDCSGLAMKAYAQVGIYLPHSSNEMLDRGRRVTRAQLQPGDLIFPHEGHVQIYLGAGKVVEAAQSGVPVRITDIWGFMTARRLL